MKKLLLMFALAGTLAFSQTQVAPIVNPHIQLFNAGVPCSGCLLDTFSAGTTTPLVTYSESTGTTPNANPVVADASGFVTVYLTLASYKLRLRTAAGVTIWTQDGVNPLTAQSTFAGISSTGDITIQQPTAATSGANQSSFSLKLQGKYWNGSASATDQWQFQNVLGSGSNPSSTLNVTHSGSSGTAVVNFNPALTFANTTFTNPTLAGTITASGNITATAGQNFINAYRLNSAIYVDGVKYPLTQTGVQAAFTDACALGLVSTRPGTDVYLPPMVIALSNGSGQQFLVTCNLHIHGAGDQSTLLDVAVGVPNGVPVFRFKPDHIGAQSDILIEGVEITSDGSNGGDALLFDGTNTGISGPNNFVVRKNHIHGLSAGAWAINETANGTPGLSQMGWNIVENNTLAHGIHLDPNSAVDGWLILHNIFGSDSGNTTACVDASTANNGASHIVLLNNIGGCNGGFFISHGTHECKILYNQIEQPFASVETNSAMIDLIGDTFSIDQCEIRGNNIGSANLSTIGIRVGTATGTIISGNTIGIKAATGVGIVLAAASSGTIMDASNTFVGVGGGAVAMTNASGANPFAISLPTSTNTLPSTIKNDTAGGILFTVNGGSSWSIGNGGTLFSPAGAGVGLNGGSAGTTSAIGLPNAGGTLTPLDINSGTVAKAQVASDFTTANNTSLQTITGLSWTVLANARNLSFHCSLAYSQATAAVSDTFGIQVATNAPTNVFATGKVWTNATGTNADGVLATLSTTTATNIVTFTPSATATNFVAELNGTIELPASANTINIMVSTSAGADAVTVKRGSYCELF